MQAWTKAHTAFHQSTSTAFRVAFMSASLLPPGPKHTHTHAHRETQAPAATCQTLVSGITHFYMARWVSSSLFHSGTCSTGGCLWFLLPVQLDNDHFSSLSFFSSKPSWIDSIYNSQLSFRPNAKYNIGSEKVNSVYKCYRVREGDQTLWLFFCFVIVGSPNPWWSIVF